MDLKRSNIEFAKRVWLDRKTAFAPYVYGGCYNAINFGLGADCSGSNGVFISAAFSGAQSVSWDRQFSTESFPGPFPAFRKVDRDTALHSDSPIKVFIRHGGGGPNSHMACEIDGWHLESSGTYGTCGGPNNADGNGIPISSPYWNDWWVFDGGIDEDIPGRQMYGYPRVLDYAGGAIPGAELAAAGVVAVCRYLSPGGASLPGKLLTAPEVADLHNNGIGIVPNWETTANMMLRGFDGGVSDAHAARNYCDHMGFPPDQVIYFSADWDVTPTQQATVDDYLRGVATVIDANSVGIYGGYWSMSRALDAGVAKYGWQTEAWSTLNPKRGINVDNRAVLVQRNVTMSQGQTIAGIPTDINDLHRNIHAWGGNTMPDSPEPPKAFPDDWTDRELLVEILRQQRGYNLDGYEQLGQNAEGLNLSLVDAVAAARRDIKRILNAVSTGTQRRSFLATLKGK